MVGQEAGQGGGLSVRLIVRPQGGVAPVLKATREARRSIDKHTS